MRLHDSPLADAPHGHPAGGCGGAAVALAVAAWVLVGLGFVLGRIFTRLF